MALLRAPRRRLRQANHQQRPLPTPEAPLPSSRQAEPQAPYPRRPRAPRNELLPHLRQRDAIYARHGRPFANPDLQTFFYGPLPAELAGKWTLKEKKAYNDKLLTDTDKENLALIQKYEAQAKAASK